MTKLNYLSDSFIFESQATVKEIKQTEVGMAVVLDQTIFYPQGGGQPADKGIIYSDDAEFEVVDVRLDRSGDVYHYGGYDKGEFVVGDTVNLKIDKDRRVKNTKLHSAGHLLDAALEKLGIDEIKPVKGFHFSDGPYVEYEGMLENPWEYVKKVEETANEMIKEKVEVEKKELSNEEAEKRGVWAPPGKSARIINFKGYKSCGCGGTHVNNAGEIGKITIRKISSKKGKTRIAYIVE
ncbi:alanine--tRNA ligase-related protein [Patescibacteria group bacterium]